MLEQSRTNLIGPHNAENMLAALAVGDVYEIPHEATIRALSAYHPLPHRLEKVAEIGGVTFLNDSKATNIDALEKALMAMRAPAVLIAGGKDKGLDFTGLRPLVHEKVKAVVLIGTMTEKLFRCVEFRRALHARDPAGRRRRQSARAGAVRRRCAALARLLQLRHVQELRGPRRPVPRTGPRPAQPKPDFTPNIHHHEREKKPWTTLTVSRNRPAA